jgi:hypothetical protein
MQNKLGVVLALSAALLVASGSRASAQVIRAGVYVSAPPAYVEVVPVSPGPEYIWAPQYHRWVLRGWGWGFDHGRRYPIYYRGGERFGARRWR